MSLKTQESVKNDTSESTEKSAKGSPGLHPAQKNRVRFDETSKAPTTRNKTVMGPTKNSKPSNPAKVKVSPKEFLLHLGCAVGFLVFYFTFTFMTRHNRNKHGDGSKHSQLSSLVDVLAKADSMFTETFVEPDIPDSTLDLNLAVSDTSVQSNKCTIYLAESSIPNNGGFGLFTAKPFKEGDTIMSKDGETLTIGGVKVNPMFLAIRHHPLFGNVDFFKKGSPFVVSSRSIESGEELFLDMSDLEENKLNELPLALYNEFRSDPTIQVYDQVDEIVRNLLDSIPYRKGSSKNEIVPKKKNYKQRTVNKVKTTSKPTIDAAPVLQMMKKTLEGYDPVIATLIPKTTAAARTITEKGGSAHFVSNNRTSDWLSEHGVCLDGVYQDASTMDEAREGFFASREISKGDIVMTAPMLALQSSEVSDASKRACFYHDKYDEIVLCPLSFAYHFNLAPKMKLGCNDTTEKRDCPSNTANSYYKWSEVNSWNAEEGKLTLDYFIQNPLTSLTIDIIASRRIGKDEEVLIDYQPLGGVLSKLNS